MARCAVGLLLMAVLLAVVFLPSVETKAIEEARCQASEKIAREISDKIAKRAKEPLFSDKMCKLDRMLPIVIVVVKRGETFEMEYDPYSSEFIYENKHSIDLQPFLCKDLSGAGANDYPKENSVTPTDNSKKDEEPPKGAGTNEHLKEKIDKEEVNLIKDFGEGVRKVPELLVNVVETGVDNGRELLVKGKNKLLKLFGKQ